MMNLIFRKLDEKNPSDVKQFNELMEELVQAAADIEILKENIRKANSYDNYYLMAVEDTDNSRICGSLLAIIFDDFCGDCKPLMVVENVVTHHEYYKKGIGRKMFDEIGKWGKERNVNYALLCSDMDRTGAHEFYRAIGCTEVKGFKKYL